ncbi:MAG: hypothetical protein RMJ44_11515 [Cytophagales bacterium]|nr:hypothetical protein [Bernardetiaceae bacterium]MDW8211704.1 hypothetical protein [Cytophagales bacterium]
MAFHLEEVTTARSRREFLLLPVRLYKDTPYWVRPLDSDIEKIFDPSKNKSFEQGACIRWLLKTPKGETIGRVAAFVNHKTAWQDNDQPTGGMGFFECVRDRAAAFTLFDACKHWLEQQGMQAMDGPINFGQRDSWWGLLVEGYDKMPNYGMPYHFPYYREFFEAYGFREYFRQFTFYRNVEQPLQQMVHQRAERIYRNPDYHFECVDKKKLAKYAEDFCTIYNKAWVKHEGIPPMTRQQAQALIEELSPILDPRIIYFAYFKNQPIAFFINIPDLNQALKVMNTGKFNLLGLLRFFWFKLTRDFDKMVSIVFGVVPEFQGRGVESAIVAYARQITNVDNFQYKHMELNWIGDFNPKMVKLAQMMGGQVCKTHITYRYLFNPQQPFRKPSVIQ